MKIKRERKFEFKVSVPLLIFFFIFILALIIAVLNYKSQLILFSFYVLLAIYTYLFIRSNYYNISIRYKQWIGYYLFCLWTSTLILLLLPLTTFFSHMSYKNSLDFKQDAETICNNSIVEYVKSPPILTGSFLFDMKKNGNKVEIKEHVIYKSIFDVKAVINFSCQFEVIDSRLELLNIQKDEG